MQTCQLMIAVLEVRAVPIWVTANQIMNAKATSNVATTIVLLIWDTIQRQGVAMITVLSGWTLKMVFYRHLGTQTITLRISDVVH